MEGDGSEISAPSPATEHDVPDELLELVFLRLPSSLHLVRAACTCKRWRRIIADGAFLGRFRSLRAPHVVAGHYRVDERTHGSCRPGCNPVFSLSPSADTGNMLPQHFSLDFLPDYDLSRSSNGTANRSGSGDHDANASGSQRSWKGLKDNNLYDPWNHAWPYYGGFDCMYCSLKIS